MAYSWWREQLRQKQVTTSLKNKFIECEIVCNGIWQKQLLILKFEKGFFVDQTIFSWLLRFTTYGWSSVKWKFEAVKLQNWTPLTKNSQSKSIVLIALDKNSTLPFILVNFHITMKFLEIMCTGWWILRLHLLKLERWKTVTDCLTDVFSCSETEV